VLGACWPLVMEESEYYRRKGETRTVQEGRLTEIRSKWLKKKKRWSEVRERKSLDEEIEEDRSTRKVDHGQLSKRKKSTGRCFGEPRGKEGKTGWRSPENVGQVDLGF
jgi:hypothetical protein